jgi:copper chaperone
MHSHNSVVNLSSVGLFLVILNSYRIKYFSKKNDDFAFEKGVSFKVTGMTCSHCEESVKKTLMKLEGIKSVDIDLETGQVTIESELVDFDLIKQSVKELGYEVIDE